MNLCSTALPNRRINAGIKPRRHMQDRFEINIHALRQIGWDNWDPIGIRQLDDSAWRTDAADEYDTYLLQAAEMILHGSALETVAAYLDKIVSEYMGLEPVNEAIRHDSMRAAAAIAAYVNRA